jgi:hypothetical protein
MGASDFEKTRPGLDCKANVNPCLHRSPLLYEAKWDSFCHNVIGVKVFPRSSFKAHLWSIYPDADLALSLASTNQFPVYEKTRRHLLLVNDASVEAFVKASRHAVDTPPPRQIRPLSPPTSNSYFA